jgi:hypothetical protein
MIRQRQEIADGKPRAAFVMSRQITNTKLVGEAKAALILLCQIHSNALADRRA